MSRKASVFSTDASVLSGPMRNNVDQKRKLEWFPVENIHPTRLDSPTHVRPALTIEKEKGSRLIT